MINHEFFRPYSSLPEFKELQAEVGVKKAEGMLTRVLMRRIGDRIEEGSLDVVTGGRRLIEVVEASGILDEPQLPLT